MVTFKFTAGQADPVIFQANPQDYWLSTLEIPLVLGIPRGTVKKIGTDETQRIVTVAVERMIRELNSELSTPS